MNSSPPFIDLRPDHWEIVLEILQRRLPSRHVFAFGSRATWTAKDYSDLDLAIMGEQPLPLSELSALNEEFVESDLPFRVDIVDFASVDVGFRTIIQQHGVSVHPPMDVKNSTIHVSRKDLRTVQRLIEKHHPSTDAWVYGERLKEECSPKSDLNVVVFSTPEQQPKVSNLQKAFDESDLSFRVNLSVWDDLPMAFKGQTEMDHMLLITGFGETKKRADHVAFSDWNQLSFSEAVQINPKSDLEKGNIYPFVNMAAVNIDSRYVCPCELREFKGGGARFREGDTLMARITPCLENGKIAQYSAPKFERNAHGSTEFIIIRGRPGITDNSFAYYLTKSEKIREFAIGQMTGTSGRQRVPTASLRHLTISLPSLPEQRTIAHVLGTLDEKIELKHRVNATLEEMARTLFKSWFVDFDPVRAKMEGRDTGFPKHIADLFPDRLTESELGEIPKGWHVKKLKDCMNITMGQSPPSSTYNNHGDGLPFFQGRAEFGVRYPEKQRFCSAPTRVAYPEDTLVSVRAPVGDINLAWEECCIGRGVAALRHKSGSSSFTYHLVGTLRRELEQYEQMGTVFGAINKGQINSLRVLDPDARIVEAFDVIVINLDAQIRSNFGTTRTLAALRDTLLPKLVSGEVRL